MKRFAAVLSSVAAAAILAGCSTVAGPTSSEEGPVPIDLSKPSVMTSLCGDEAEGTLAFITERADAPANSGLRKELEDWGIDDPTDDEYIANILDRLTERAEMECENSPDDGGEETDNESDEGPTLAECVAFSEALNNGSFTEGGSSTYIAEYITTMKEACDTQTAGALNYDGEVLYPQFYTGSGNIGANAPNVVVDSTQDPNTPALLDGSLRYENITQNWGDLVERVGDQQWYKDGIDARETQTGFGWDEILKFAAIEEEFAEEDVVLETRVIQVFNLPAMSDEEVRDAVRPYLGNAADTLPIVHIDQPFFNTINVGTADAPRMGDYLDGQQMVRVSLVPIALDDNGEPILDEDGLPMLDMTRHAGVFIDCGNLHWIPPFVTICTDESCQPECPPWWPHGTPGLCKDDPNRDPDAEGHNWEGGSGWNPGINGPASPPAAGNPPTTYVWTPPVTSTDPPAGSNPDTTAPPTTIEGEDPATEEDPATGCVPGFGVTC